MAIENDEPTIGDDGPRRRSRMPHAPLPTQEAATVAEVSQVGETVYAEEDSRTRAARRAAELRDHMGSMDDSVDKFYIDSRVIPAGWSYEWKRWSTLNKEDPSYQVELARHGWEPVPASRHPDMMPTNWAGITIDRDGMRLMERPLEITQEVMRRDKKAARDLVRNKEQQLTGAPAGDNSPFDADNKGNSLVKIRKSYEPMEIPK
jgi:hypothetical protein